jgi:SAM-dependent methyltransferase
MRILPKPKGLGPMYGAQFGDQSVADAYPTRPPYPPELFTILLGLIRDQSPGILDLGCGTGDIARRFAPHVTHIDAVDPSGHMIACGQALLGGQHPNIQWIVSSAEDFAYRSTYALVVTAESLHWMDWPTVLPHIRHSLTPQGRLAIVLGRGFQNEPWAEEVGHLIAQYSTNRAYESYNLLAELAKRGLFTPEQSLQTTPIPFTQSVDAYVESFHSRNGLSRERMGPSAAAFDRQLKAIIAKYQPNPVLTFELVANVAWGVPSTG